MTDEKRAIRAKCMECSGNSARDVRNCFAKDCPLYPFRMPEAKKNNVVRFGKQIGMNELLKEAEHG